MIASLAQVVLADDPHQRISPGGPIGAYSVEQWKKDWPGCRYEDGVKEGRLSIVQTANGPAFRVDYAIGEIGPAQGGAGWRFPIKQADCAELTYTLAFTKDFDWVKGGKLPGLSGGPDSVTGGNPANGRNGFSVRLMWRKDGRGEAYVYHMHQPGKYGESLSFPPDFRFPTSDEIKIRLRVSLNKIGQRNGKLDVWAGSPGSSTETHLLSRSDMEWRSDPSLSIDSLLFETFHGGGDETWAPRHKSSTTFSNISIAWPQHPTDK